MDFMNKFWSFFWRLTEGAMAIIMVIMLALLFVNVVLRYGFSSGLLASAEIARFLFVWTIMFGAVICLRDHEHLDLRVIDKILPPKAVWVLRRAVNLVILVSSLMLLVGSYRQTFANWPNISPMSGIPVGVMYLAGAFAGAAMGAIALYRVFSSKSDDVAHEEELL